MSTKRKGGGKSPLLCKCSIWKYVYCFSDEKDGGIVYANVRMRCIMIAKSLSNFE